MLVQGKWCMCEALLSVALPGTYIARSPLEETRGMACGGNLETRQKGTGHRVLGVA